ncbi:MULTISPECIES: P-II family nitrogen regulator [Ramlibacter]|uniref:P-II family nitrogen regulator n=1 Tax=Ramlibacter aquaticus TaxID=2780094 RepID=A0ABR9SFL9_9BURK|nr:MULTISPECIES: P-II family nitrogen regulator [Ramlibacter]MBE7940699.1 P-II family nitrogen regulator [Ramlibacter aquaticus]
MKEIKAYIHAHRVGAVIAALKASAAWAAAADKGVPNLAVYLVKGTLLPLDEWERQYSVELGDEVVNEYKLELLCEGEHVDELVGLIRQHGRTGQRMAGWVYVTEVEQASPIA